MGKPTAPKKSSRSGSAYRAVPEGEVDDAVSMHTTPDDYAYDDVPDLPSYTDSEAAQNNSIYARGAVIPPVQDDRYTSIPCPDNKPVNGQETTIRMNEELNHPAQLLAYVADYLRIVPPNPVVRFYGSHKTTTRRNNKTETENVIDFDFTIGLGKYLGQATPGDEEGWWQPRTVTNGEKAHRGGFWPKRAKGYKQDIEIGSEPERDLMAWCNDYCNSQAKLKIFRVTRNVVGLDTKLLLPQLERLVRSTHYRGNISITFPVEDKNVDIYSPHVVNRWRISWVRYIFYVTFLWLFTWPLLFFLTARWSVYHVDWIFSRKVQTPSGTNTEWVTISEQEWLEKHRKLIASLVLDGHKGDATEFPLDVQPRSRRPDLSRVSTGNSNVDSALGVIQGGLNVWNAVQGRDGDGWGADEC